MKDNWHQVKEIFVGALRHETSDRSGFIAEQCGGNPGLQAEVESLLSSYDSSESFMESTAVEEVAEALITDSSRIKDGDFLKHYRIVRKIGAGGMGEVYLASDTKLGRQVAIKILSESFESRKSNLKRFFLEAKAASALNHPNIMVVHEIGELDGTHYIAAEYIEGETLSEVLVKRNLSLTEIVDISTQIVGALGAAHEVGVIHRDIKTDNLMLRADGLIKVLDFGLVKMAEKKGADIDFDADTQELMNTRDGMILGTAAYMSPEQARGKPVDLRTDIWSFGVVLFQLVTRALPFPGETPSDIIASILKSDPENMRKYVDQIPVEIESIVRRSLEKDPNNRYAAAGELLEDLKYLKHKLEVGGNTEPLKHRIREDNLPDLATDGKLTAVTAAPERMAPQEPAPSYFTSAFSEIRTRPRLSALVLASVALFITVGYFGFTRLMQSSPIDGAFQKMRLTKLTFEGRATDVLAVSPDGKYVAYARKEGGNQALVVRQVETSGVVELIPAGDLDYDGLSFSPDGNFVYYSAEKAMSGHELFRIPVLGGTPKKVISDLGIRWAFSPNGKKIAYFRSQTSLTISEADGSGPKVISNLSGGEVSSFLTWNPNGTTIVAASYSRTTSRAHLVEIDIADGSQKRLNSVPWKVVSGLRWLADGSGIILSGRDEETEFSQIWLVSYPDGKLRRITNDFSTYFDIDLTSANNSIVSVKHESLFNIWTTANGDTRAAKKITIDEGREDGRSGVESAPDGRIVYTVRKANSIDLWIVNPDGSENIQLTADSGLNFFPVITPDGKQILFTSSRGGNLDLWRMDLNGENQSKLTNTPEKEDTARLTPDGEWVVFRRMDENNRTTIWKMKLSGGDPVQLTDIQSDTPVVSPDGQTFACKYGEPKPGQPVKIAIIPIDGGKPLRIFDAPKLAGALFFRWSGNGQSLLYVDDQNQAGNIWAYPIDGGEPKQLTFFESGTIQRFDRIPDSDGFVLSRGNESADLVMISNFR